MPVFVTIPIPRTLGQAEIVHNAQPRHALSENAAMVEPAPNSLSAPPFTSFPTFVTGQIAPSGHVLAGTLGQRAAVFRHDTGNAGPLEVDNIGPVAIIPGHIAYLVYTVIS